MSREPRLHPRRRQDAHWSTAALPLALLVAACEMPSFLLRRPAPEPPAPLTFEPEPERALRITALPVYRLVTSPAVADLPSRLVVIQVRMTAGAAAIQVALDDITVALADGRRGRVLDPGRAREVLRRTILVDADLAYTRTGTQHPPGGLDPRLRPRLAAAVADELFDEAILTEGEAAQGYLVVDTEQPLLSLDGAAIEVAAVRFGDPEPVRTAFRFTADSTTEAQ
jgi:hypothetical protein